MDTTRLALIIYVFVALMPGGMPARAAEPPPETAGALDAVGPGGQRLGTCPLEHTDVSAEIAGFVARVTVTQRFKNPFAEPVEATYTFPLSERAAVDDMSMRTGERVIRGDIKRREEARQIYEAARQSGRTAALLDQERPNIFTQALANLMPGASVEIRIEYVEPLIYRDGAFEFAFPTVVGPRFIPGEPTGHAGSGWAPDTTRVPDASRITPPVTPKGTRAGHDLGISVDIDAGVPILDVSAPLHAIDVERPAASRAHVRLREQHEIPNRDFVLRYAVAGDEVRSGYLVHRDGEGDGYATFVLLPPKAVTPETAAPKEMIFVIDRSGSQNGAPLEKAKETMLWILDHMNPQDTFQVVDFGNTANMLFAKPEPASPAMKDRARAHVRALEANGGTFMAEAVQQVCAIPADQNRLRIVTFMTDGYVGNDFEILDHVRRLRGTSRWFPFGTGNGVNRFLIDGMARAGGGEAYYALLDEPGERVAAQFYEHIAAPALTDVRLEFRGLDLVDVFPHEPADVWEQRPLIVHARYRTPGSGEIVLRGFRQGRPYRQTLDVTLPARTESDAAIASMWARAKVDELMWQDMAGLQSGTFPPALREEIVATALAHRLVTQFTSFVAVEDRVVNEGGAQRTVTVPVEMPHGVRYEGVFGREVPAAAGGALPRSLASNSAAGFAAAEKAARQPLADRLSRRADPTQRDEERGPKPLSTLARSRIAPELVALLEGGPAGAAVRVVDGRVEVKVTLHDTRPRSLRRLAAAGLRLHQVAGRYVIGTIEVSRLGALAEVDRVDRITLP